MNAADRYTRAARLLPANMAAALVNNAVHGYWIDDRRYFFLYEAMVAGAVRRVPMMHDAQAGETRALASDDDLRRWFPDAPAATVAAADFDLPEPGRLAVRLAGRSHLIDLARDTVVADRHDDAPLAYAPGGRHAVRVAGHDLALIDLVDGVERRLTADGIADCPWGQAPQTYAATISYRRQPFPVVQFSADGRWLLADRIDERHLPLRTLVENAPADGGPPRFHVHRFATAADVALPIATTAAIELATGRRIEAAPRPVHMFPPVATRHAWFAGDAFYALRTDRWHRHLELAEVRLCDGRERIVAEERVEGGYLEAHPLVGAPPNVRVLPATGELIWWSERDGRGHLYLLDAATGGTRRQITRGDFQVRDILHVEEATRTLLLAVTGLDPTDYLLRTIVRAHLDRDGLDILVRPCGADLGARAALDGPFAADRPYALPRGPGSVSPGGHWAVVRRASPANGVTTIVADLATGRETTLATLDRAAITMSEPVWLDLVAADGATPLRAALYLPADHDGEAALPLIDCIYPGPQSVVLARSFWGRMQCQAQALAALGFAVVVADTRGLPMRPRALHQAGYGDLLEPQLADHVAIVAQLRARFAFIDRARAGIVGSSAGGYASATALFRYPDIFTAGVAICGTDDPAHYFAGWLEKYVGPDGDDRWARQVTGREAAGLRGALMIVHGDMDENVHPAHAISLARRLTDAGKSFDLVIVPNEGHLLQATSADVQRRMWDFFLRHLRGEEPPGDDHAPRYRAEDVAAMARAAAHEAAWQ